MQNCRSINLQSCIIFQNINILHYILKFHEMQMDLKYCIKLWFSIAFLLVSNLQYFTTFSLKSCMCRHFVAFTCCANDPQACQSVEFVHNFIVQYMPKPPNHKEAAMTMIMNIIELKICPRVICEWIILSFQALLS